MHIRTANPYVIAVGITLSTSFAFAAVQGEAGKKIYDTKCISCHGKDGKGNSSMSKVFKVDPSALNLTIESTQKKSDDDLQAVISLGKNKMPAYSKQMKAEEVKSVVQYLRSLSPIKKEAAVPAVKTEEKKEEDKVTTTKTEEKTSVPASTETVSETAKKEYAKSCASCHGKDSEGNAAMAGVFKVDPSALDLADDTTLAKSDEELSKIIADGMNKMPAYKGKIADGLISEIIVYIRSLKELKK